MALGCREFFQALKYDRRLKKVPDFQEKFLWVDEGAAANWNRKENNKERLVILRELIDWGVNRVKWGEKGGTRWKLKEMMKEDDKVHMKETRKELAKLEM